jgi:hypothetical protein
MNKPEIFEKGLFTIPNTQASLIERKLPWEHEEAFKLPKFDSSAEYKNWASRPDTRYLAYSMNEGVDPSQRISANNDPLYVHGVVGDWDAKFSEEEVNKFVSESLNTEYPVSWISRSYNGGIHALWVFEDTVMSHGRKSVKRFLERVAKETKMEKLARGFDKASTDPHRYFYLGHSWKKVSPTAIPLRSLHYWQYETSKSTDFEARGQEIDLDVVREEIDEQFPNSWTGIFRDGARGRRFWDAAADNPSAAVVRATGMQCFTGPQPFLTWSEILGPRFVAQFEIGRIGEAIERYWFDGRSYYVRRENGGYIAANKEEAVLDLKCRTGLNGSRRRTENVSEVERALYQIHNEKRVEAAVPFVFIKENIVRNGNQRFFNTSHVTTMTPADGKAGKWGTGFPYISKWLEELLGEEQLEYEKAWLAYAYQGAHKGSPQSGHAHFLLGPPGCGKTLYNTQVLAPLFGGHIKASEYLTSKTDFNDYLFEIGLWTVDDEAPSSSNAMRAAFTSRVKEFVANHEFTVNGKFKKTGRVFWKGRLSVTLNDDPVSMRLLPDLDMSVVDKLMVLKCNAFNDFDETTPAKIALELPYFARWLLSHKVPKALHEPRFGVKAYINEEVKAVLKADSSHSHIAELLNIFRTNYQGDEPWEGTCSDLIVLLTKMEGCIVLLRDINARSLGWGLRSLHSKGAHPWLSRSDTKGSYRWVILQK